jgi:hypothetical protein
MNELASLIPGKSSGPDDINARLLKVFSGDFAKPLTFIFRQTFQFGVLPSDWKSAVISPIYKGGCRSSPNSFRPISLTCICCKILERIVKRQLTDYLEINSLFTNAQHGFRQNRSCLTNLLLSFEDWTKSVDAKQPVDVIYIDFKKAFDSVPHKRLLQKIRTYGISGQLFKWIQCFLLGRTQRVNVNGSLSNCVTVQSGVPQGSVLGPLLFLLYVNDIPRYIDCNILMFADDVKIWKSVASLADSANLQGNIDALQLWSRKWLLGFNVDKCVTMHLSSTHSTTSAGYFINNEPLREVIIEKDLGVLVDARLKPNKQCVKASKRAMSIMRRIKRTFPNITPEIFQKVYPAFVRPHLEYAIQAWRPWLQKDITLLENVQRRSTKLVSCLRNVDYQIRESSLKLFPVMYRQTRGDLIMAFKIIRQYNTCLEFNEFFAFATTGNLRGHPFKLRKFRSSSLLRSSSFSQRIVNLWNALPEIVVSSPNVAIFKARLDNYLCPDRVGFI